MRLESRGINLINLKQNLCNLNERMHELNVGK